MTNLIGNMYINWLNFLSSPPSIILIIILALLYFQYHHQPNSTMSVTRYDTSTPSGWRKALESLPERKDGSGAIPTFFFVSCFDS